MAKLIVKRSSEWANRFRDLELQLNGKLLGSITNGEVREFDLPPGRHTLKSTIDWCSSPEIELELRENETREVEIGSFKGVKTLLKLEWVLLPLFFAVIFFQKYLDLHPAAGYVALALVLPPYVFLIYKLTIDRKHYLQLHLK